MSEWKFSELRQLVSFQKGRKVEVLDHLVPGFVPYLGANAISTNSTLEYADTHGAVLASEKDILMLWDGERSGLVGKGQRGVVSSTVAKLTPISSIDHDFLFYSLSSNFSWIQNRRTGTGIPHVPKDLGRILKIPYPQKKECQRRIAEILSTVDEAIEETEALIAKTQSIKAGLMQDLFSRGVLPNGELRPTREEAPQLYKETPLGWIPKEWECVCLEDLLAKAAFPMRSGPFGSSLLKSELVDNGIPLLGIDNVFPERFEATYHRFISKKKYHELSQYTVYPGDIVITIMGTVGRCCVIPDDIESAISSKHLWVMTFNEQQVIPKLICWQLNDAPYVKEWFINQSQGAVMDAIQSSTLRKLILPVQQMDEQICISDRYDSYNRNISEIYQELNKLRLLKSGLMQDLLTGRVRVPGAEDTAE
jgi:type I restriction enzyme, S subunit